MLRRQFDGQVPAIVTVMILFCGFAHGAGTDVIIDSTRLHGEPHGVSEAKEVACGKVLVLRMGPRRVEQFSDLRLNSRKVAEFFETAAWSLESVEKPKERPLVTFAGNDLSGFEVTPRRLQIRAIGPRINPNAGLGGPREEAPERVRTEVGRVQMGPFAGRATARVNRDDGTRVVIRFERLNRRELLHLLNQLDEMALQRHNFTRDQIKDGQDLFRDVLAEVIDPISNQRVYVTPRNELTDESAIGNSLSYSVRVFAPVYTNIGMNIDGDYDGPLIANQETNAVRLMEFMADFLKGRFED